MIKEKKVKASNISFTLASSDIVKREVIIPIVQEEDESSLIEFEIEQYLPGSTEEYIVQSRGLGSIEINDEKKKKLLVAAMPKEIADLYYKLAVDLKLKPSSFDIHCNAMLNLIKHTSLNSAEKSFERESSLVVEINHNFIDVFIIEKGNYKFGRRIFSGVQELIRLRNVEENLEKLDFKNFLEEENITIIQEIDYWIGEIKKIIKYYEDLLDENEIKKIFLYGDGALIRDIDKMFSVRLDLKTEVFEANSVVNLNDKINSDDLASYMNAIGALINE
jgi:type IV pilus assembly protein PilM